MFNIINGNRNGGKNHLGECFSSKSAGDGSEYPGPAGNGSRIKPSFAGIDSKGSFIVEGFFGKAGEDFREIASIRNKRGFCCADL
jgi:hypothetical protein